MHTLFLLAYTKANAWTDFIFRTNREHHPMFLKSGSFWFISGATPALLNEISHEPERVRDLQFWPPSGWDTWPYEHARWRCTALRRTREPLGWKSRALRTWDTTCSHRTVIAPRPRNSTWNETTVKVQRNIPASMCLFQSCWRLMGVKIHVPVVIFLFLKFLEDVSPFVGLLIPLFWTSGDVREDPLAYFLTCVIFRFTSGVTPADWIEVSMAAEPFWSTYLQMCPQALVEVWGLNPWLPVQQAQHCKPLGHPGSAARCHWVWPSFRSRVLAIMLFSPGQVTTTCNYYYHSC